jgi:hypothetical protein
MLLLLIKLVTGLPLSPTKLATACTLKPGSMLLFLDFTVSEAAVPLLRAAGVRKWVINSYAARELGPTHPGVIAAGDLLLEKAPSGVMEVVAMAFGEEELV